MPLTKEWPKSPGIGKSEIECSDSPAGLAYPCDCPRCKAKEPITWVCESCEGSFQKDKPQDPSKDFCPFCGADSGAAWDIKDVVFLIGGGFVPKG